MQDAPLLWQRAQGRPSGRGSAELDVGSGAGPGRALRSRRMFRHRSVAATSAAAAASSSPPPPPRSSASAARGTPGNAAGGVRESCPTGSASSSCGLASPLPFHGSAFRHSQSERLKVQRGGRGQFIFFSLLSPKNKFAAHLDDFTASEITRKGSTAGPRDHRCACALAIQEKTLLPGAWEAKLMEERCS